MEFELSAEEVEQACLEYVKKHDPEHADQLQLERYSRGFRVLYRSVATKDRKNKERKIRPAFDGVVLTCEVVPGKGDDAS